MRAIDHSLSRSARFSRCLRGRGRGEPLVIRRTPSVGPGNLFLAEKRHPQPLPKGVSTRARLHLLCNYFLTRSRFSRANALAAFSPLRRITPRRAANKGARTRRVGSRNLHRPVEFVPPRDSIVFLAVSVYIYILRSQRGSVGACFIPITINATLIALSWPLLIGSFKRHCFGLMLLPVFQRR